MGVGIFSAIFLGEFSAPRARGGGRGEREVGAPALTLRVPCGGVVGRGGALALAEGLFYGGGAEGFHFGEALFEEAGVFSGEVVDVGGVDHDFAGAWGEVGEEVLPDGDGGVAGGGEAEEPVGDTESGGGGFFGVGAGVADLDAVGEWEFDAGEGDFAGAAEGGDVCVFADLDEEVVEGGDVGDVFVGVNVGRGEVAVFGVLDLGAEFVGGLLAGVF